MGADPLFAWSSPPSRRRKPWHTTKSDGTQMNFQGVGDVHVCAKNEPMLGLDAKNNRFLCSTTVAVPAPSSWAADTSSASEFYL